MSENLKENYSLMFTTYPDIVDITQMRKMLGNIGVTLAYKLLKQGKLVENIRFQNLVLLNIY